MTVKFEGKAFRGNWLVRICLKERFYGLGKHNAEAICAKLGFYPQIRWRQLSEPQLLELSKELRNYKIEDEARNEMRSNIALKRQIGSFVGRRHAMGYPVRGQRTQNNAQTAKRLNRINRRNYSTNSTNDTSTFMNRIRAFFGRNN
ncbi:hypothetical protein V1511DRAFT_499255 [Dipodascopsis uninucleata]